MCRIDSHEHAVVALPDREAAMNSAVFFGPCRQCPMA